ncbi:P-loop containing nucleoside triphosphate hydrolase protein [Halteromyces radiatus]|uniref:P-loop containing nucleoside triphosphate hydrolase protein n=1 Tax=Halteromyces radiatus TaxID=101107 RepID=UPI00221FC0DA|nr:P-loop containing nucleoside triphosphate hydrolase protein [Halteromyces radiatus]KAI8086524.1 P-loop containing nucleoside triphosphate hydrolase protein [Halteromyces radiatus]
MTGSPPSTVSSTHTVQGERTTQNVVTTTTTIHTNGSNSNSLDEKHISDIEELPIQQTTQNNDGDSNLDEKNGKKKKKEKKKKEPSVPIYRLFRFATAGDLALIALACIFSAGIGAIQPATIVIFGNFLGQVQSTFSATMMPGAVCEPSNKGLDATMGLILTFVYMGTAVLIAAYLTNAFWVWTGERQTRRIRTAYVHAILRQEMGWFDKAEEGSLTTRLAADTQLIQDGISEKFGLFVAAIAQFISGFIIAFVKGPKMAAVMLATMPLLAGAGAAMGYFITKYTLKAQDSYADAGSVVEQAFAGIRTVSAFSIQNRFFKRYDQELVHARDVGIMRGRVLGFGFGTFMFILFSTYGLAFWYGSHLVMAGEFDASQVLIVFFAMIIGAIALLQLPPNISAVSSAAGAAYKIFATIDRVPEIDSDSKEGLTLEKVHGDIEFRDIKFVYPTRPDITILKKLNLKIHPGMTVAFVGPSGSGKSTSISLLQRFYDPIEGQVLLDGKDLKDYNVAWLRRQIGVVSQEPVLFNMSIKQNLMMGATREVTHDEMVEACKKANCHLFITQLPQGYDTMIGGTGLLSGGQKQRIAIARAILKNPSILLLDEATSALDTQSERLVQKALDAASADRTTIVIAHRLSTIRNADLIVVMDQGDLVEQGTHNELLAQGGVYAELVKKQEIALGETNFIESEIDEDTLLKQEQAELEKAQEIQIVTEKRGSVDLVKMNSRTSAVDAYELKLKKELEEKKLASKQRTPFKRVIKQMRPEWHYLVTGVIGAAIAGAVFPCFALVFAQVLNIIMFKPPSEMAPAPVQGANLYAFLFLIIGIAAFGGFSVQLISFETAGEHYTKRLRGQIFQAYLRQETGFFDDEEHTVGALTSKLAIDAKNVNELVTKTWGDVTQICVTGITGLAIAFSHSWTLTLIILCMAPFIMFATAYESRIHRGFEDKTKKANEQSGEVAGEAIKEIRTVASLHRQQHFEDRFYKATERPHQLARNKAITASLGYGLHQGINIYTNAVAFYAGIRLMDNCTISFLQMFTTMMVVMISAQGVGRASVFTSVFAKAKISAIATFEVMDRTPKIDPELEGIEPETINGNVDFENITFRYPARPDVPIFNGEFNLHGKANTTIALVGPSGCGKSTTIGMLQRWYDPLNGSVRVDDHNANSFTLGNLRSHMALVGQEPTLFDLSIGDNIRYGVEEHKTVSQEEVEEACKSANIHKFIMGLPQGYNTRVGDKGSQLSGGQKQRIAIARALIRKPKILLLDEATSALDSESEKLVQAAIDKILDEKDSGRTTITIAHRLSTIQGADMICVIKDGRVIEQGSHFELLKLNGVYSELVHQQSLSAN